MQVGTERRKTLHPGARSLRVARSRTARSPRAGGDGKCFLFTGDIKKAGEREVVAQWQRLNLGRVDVLLATHLRPPPGLVRLRLVGSR